MKNHPFNLKKNHLKKNAIATGVLLSFIATPLFSQDNSQQDQVRLESVTITGDAEERERATGSVHKIDQQALEQWHYSDVHRILEDVPGVYVRDEEGYGLRPNIGIRGASSERSKKVALMEDGILFAPAPYSAPAAYYFPMMARMQAVEVSKGPAAIKYGPNTVGGAINFVSREIPGFNENNGTIDVSAGSYGLRNVHGFYGDSKERFGWMLEGVHMQADGFKELDGGGETGFDKNDVLLKLRFNSDLSAETYHQFDIKLGYADETSNETYMGLTDDDFAANAVRRYLSTALDLMEWDHQQVTLNHFYDPGSDFVVNTSLYQRNFARVWDKINSFSGDAPTLNEILLDPDTAGNRGFYEILSGQADSFAPSETIRLLAADRSYVSRGIQSEIEWRPTFADIDHLFTIGVRYHEDEVKRDHTQRGFLMRSGQLESDGGAKVLTLQNRADAQALAIHIQDEVTLGDLTIKAGFRNEYIQTEFTNLLTNEIVSRDDNVFIPGIGLNYKTSEHVRLLGGVHKGFVPAQPGSGVEVLPEESINYELGMRYNSSALSGEVIGFYSDYSNLSGLCTLSSGCAASDIDVGFNAGEVDIWGVEADIAKTFTGGGLSYPVRLAYTFTDSEFKNSFTSPDPTLKDVSVGDQLPYIPEHQLTIKAAIDHRRWRVALAYKYIAEMRVIAGSGTPSKKERTDAQNVVDFSVNYQLSRKGQMYFTVDNLLDDVVIVSRKPFGARSGKPRTFLLGYKQEF